MRVVWVAIVMGASIACAGAHSPISQREVAALWQEPSDLERRDLFYGPGGRALAPAAAMKYTLVEADRDGFSAGYDVRDDQGRLWSVKLGPEAQTEVVASRLLWAVGYNQPPVYFVPTWKLTADGTAAAQPPGRFRLEPRDEEKLGDWAWRDNPFLGTRPFEGLFVLMVIINNWDLKTSQNGVYRVQRPGDDPRHVYRITDLGASFGKTNWLFPGTRNELEDFEREPFIKQVEGNRVTFHYAGGWREPQLIASVSPADVRWISDLLARLSSQQWRDAFRAGGFTDLEAARYIKRLREKVADGQNVE
jgi:hypothetical protein